MFRKVKVGDSLVRVMEGFQPSERWTFDGIVTNITETEITCVIELDRPRIMRFDRQTGISVNGRDFGWLEFHNAVQ